MSERHRPVWWNRRGDTETGDAEAEAMAGIRLDEPEAAPGAVEDTGTDLSGPDLSGLGPGIGAPLFGGRDG